MSDDEIGAEINACLQAACDSLQLAFLKQAEATERAILAAFNMSGALWRVKLDEAFGSTDPRLPEWPA